MDRMDRKAVATAYADLGDLQQRLSRARSDAESDSDQQAKRLRTLHGRIERSRRTLLTFAASIGISRAAIARDAETLSGDSADNVPDTGVLELSLIGLVEDGKDAGANAH